MQNKMQSTVDLLRWGASHGELPHMLILLIFWLIVYPALRALFGRGRG